MLELRVLIRSVETVLIEKQKLFLLKANQYESLVLTKTNYVREHQQKAFVTFSSFWL